MIFFPAFYSRSLSHTHSLSLAHTDESLSLSTSLLVSNFFFILDLFDRKLILLLSCCLHYPNQSLPSILFASGRASERRLSVPAAQSVRSRGRRLALRDARRGLLASVLLSLVSLVACLCSSFLLYLFLSRLTSLDSFVSSRLSISFSHLPLFLSLSPQSVHRPSSLFCGSFCLSRHLLFLPLLPRTL